MVAEQLFFVNEEVASGLTRTWLVLENVMRSEYNVHQFIQVIINGAFGMVYR